MVIGLTGPKLAGKGTTAAYLELSYGAKLYSMSGILLDISERLHLSNSRQNLIHIATGLRSTLGDDILAQVLKKDIEQAGDELAVIDGIRMPSEVKLFSQLDGFKLIYMSAPLENRYKRAIAREEKEGESEMTFEEFKIEEEAVTEKRIIELKDIADLVFENNGTIDELHEKIDDIMKTAH
ncbi:AAA family ATPase [Patescibacteria group bacterium]